MESLDRLAYDSAEYGGIDALRINPENVWLPDIVAYNRNNAQAPMFSDPSRSSNALIYPDGKVLWVPDVYEEVSQ